jgi:hypothetical protein
VSPVKYELGFYIPEDILHSHRRGNFKSYTNGTCSETSVPTYRTTTTVTTILTFVTT